MRRFLSAVTIAASIASPVWANAISFDGGWTHQRFSLFSRNDYTQKGDALDMTSDGSVSLLYHALPEQSWGASGAQWAWQVSQSVPPTDLRLKGGDDRNLALYFVFLPKVDAERLKGAKITRLLDNDAVRVLIYVWGGAHNRGAMLDSPYLGARGKTVVLRGSGTGQAREAVDLKADYAQAFGGPLTSLVGLAVSGDSDDTDSRIAARISGLTLR